jgi:hypothetical protein
MKQKSHPRPPIRHPGLVLDYLNLRDTPQNRRLLARVDGAYTVDCRDGYCSRALCHPGVPGLYAPGTTWLLATISDEGEEGEHIRLRTYPPAAAGEDAEDEAA